MLRITNWLKIVPKRHCNTPLLHRRLTSYDIRHQFLDYFIKSNDRMKAIGPVDVAGCPSADCSGTNQLKNAFFGETSACIVTADWQVVGERCKLTDAQHPSFYEMLGSWLFQDSFRKRTHELAINLLNGPCRNNDSRLLGTYFTDGDEPLKDFIDIEMRNVLENSPMETHPFIVHFLTCATLLESVDLQKATRLSDRPIIVLSSTDDQINARCCVPRCFVTDKFSAHLWLTMVANAFETDICASPSEPNVDEVCHMKPKQLTSILFDERLETAMEQASHFARINM